MINDENKEKIEVHLERISRFKGSFGKMKGDVPRLILYTETLLKDLKECEE